MKTCEKKRKHLEALTLSKEIECSVCLERVLSKPTAAERKFGLLSDCEHPFCISCIKNWRSSSPASGMDAKSTLRACPICRKVSYFVVPSAIWFSTKEEKLEIVDNYKAKLRPPNPTASPHLTTRPAWCTGEGFVIGAAICYILGLIIDCIIHLMTAAPAAPSAGGFRMDIEMGQI
ncbi:hypothetical protein Vadar_017104 [Vaccinium darrowii]|uniref:Uncharacterized protein n=1 Tax=Vaccinium darrowii TaxID=229202 RepID=A0ACB7XRC7_9ERIC|nr:hypothetical protein Vadar_017104 [Vaccinium darrowii]